jgi:hypothetical protein
VSEPSLPRPYWAEHPAFDTIGRAAAAFADVASPPAVASWAPRLARVGIGPLPVSFVEQPKAPSRRGRGERRPSIDRGALYDARIASGEVPSRPGHWHDFVNALIWATFPRTKIALHARQRAMIEARIEPGARTLPGARTREQDAIAMIDEGGLVVVATPSVAPSLAEAIERADPAAVGALVGARAACVLVFGHALLEQLILRADVARGAVLTLESEASLVAALGRADTDAIATVDARLASMLADRAAITSRSSAPGMPVTTALFARDRWPTRRPPLIEATIAVDAPKGAAAEGALATPGDRRAPIQ